jgi:hypothetical protein
MSTSWLWLNIFQSGSSLLCCWTSHHITPAVIFYNRSYNRFGACAECLIDQRLEFRGKFRDLFDHVLIDHCQTSKDHPQAYGLAERMLQTCKKDLGKFASLRTKRIGTWPYLTLPWVTRCPNMPRCFIFLFTFYFLGDIPFHPFPLLLKWTRLWIWTL